MVGLWLFAIGVAVPSFKFSRERKRLPLGRILRKVTGLVWSAVSSVVEHYLDTVGVAGSNPASRTILRSERSVERRMPSIARRASEGSRFCFLITSELRIAGHRRWFLWDGLRPGRWVIARSAA